jgi:hypothetical protein
VRSFFPIHKFDNAVGGTKMDDAELGLLINLANHWYSGHFWNVATCRGMSSATEHDSQQLYKTKLSPTLRYLVAAPFKIFGSPPLITHDSPPHCNQLGLTPLGSYLINQMIRRHFMIELDHMDVKTAADSLDIIEQRHYSGAVSAHSWDTAGDNKRIYLTGGFVAPSGQGTPAGFIRQWQIDRADLRHSYLFGFGYGSDMNGLSVQDQPTDGRDGGKSIAYPFTSFYGHVSFDREQWGNRVFDLNKDGIANDGMFADWLQALRVNADAQKPGQGNAIMADMFHGAEAYLETWERALGVPATRCLPARETFTAAGLRRAVTLGDTPAQLLLRSGQPSSRSGWSYRYCVGSATLGRESVAAVFGSGYDQVGLVTSTSRGASAGGIAVGYSQKWLTGRAREVAGDLWEGPRLASGARFIYGTRSGQIRYLAVASSTEVKRTSQLRKDLSVAGV